MRPLVWTPSFFMYDVSVQMIDAASAQGAVGCDAGVSVRAVYGRNFGAYEANYRGVAE